MSDHFGDTDIDWRRVLKWILKKYDLRACTRLILLRVGSSGELL